MAQHTYRLTLLLLICVIIPIIPNSVQESQHSNVHHSYSGGGGGGGGSSGKDNASKGIPKNVLLNWSNNFGGQLFQFGVSVTKYNELQNRFSTAQDSDVRPINLAQLILEMVNDINTNLKEKVEAVRKIMNWAEEKALEFYDKNPDSRPPPPSTYYNSKKLVSFEQVKRNTIPEKLQHKIKLSEDSHFSNQVNISFSSVHVPTSIYERKDDLIEAIGWSSNMDQTFVSNYNMNPTLNYQYFCSATGFLRHFPAMKWPNDNTEPQNPDLYDCRTRPWYVQAANTPKNMFILHDVSGSMTGIRREIAKHVVNTLLDTLTENDYVNVYNFSDVTTPVVPCYKNRLVQANLENIRELKVGLEQDHTSGIANFTSALNMAFNVLEHARTQQDSSNCNQAIMIVTDGAPFYFEEIFKARQNPEHYVRVFTYLIGREVTEKREVLWMACANRGYFTHVSTLSEVQEKVLKYMPVMSRPMVILKNHEESWTPAYAHINDIRQTDWSWLDHNAREQFKRSHRYKDLLKILQDSKPLQRADEDSISYYEFRRRVKEFMGVQSYDLNSSPVTSPEDQDDSQSSSDSESTHYTDYEHDHAFAHPQVPPEDLILRRRRKRNVKEVCANDSNPTNAIVNEINHTNVQEEEVPVALPISAKRLEVRLKNVHGVDKSVGYFSKAQKEEFFPIPVKPKDPMEPFNFTISVSTPVFDNRNSTITYEKVRVNASYTFDKPVEERIAIFLGVAGTDIPIKEMKKMASPFKLGVNGYSFMVNNNGYVVFHPDWRPVFNGELLKPNYNTVDLTEVELVDRDDNYRNNDSSLLEMRKDMIDELHAYKKGLRVRIPQDNFTENAVDDEVKDSVYIPIHKMRVRKIQDHFRRVTTRRQVYEFYKLKNTPYTLSIATPENAHKFVGEMEIRLQSENILSYFDFEKPKEQRKWKINPDWSYCDFIKGGEKHNFETAEEQLMYFLKKIQSTTSSWAWRNTGEGIKHRHQGHQGGGEGRFHSAGEHEIYKCDKELVQSLVFDANVTKIFTEMNLWKFNKNDKDLLKMNGVTSAFISTRTGLTRWMDFISTTEEPGANFGSTSEETMRFINASSSATNELWYKRAVERYDSDPESFVYSVPFDAGSRNDSHVTATRAIFVKKHGMEAPVAVVGVQFSHRKWMERFFDITKVGAFDRNHGNEPQYSCDSGAYDCFVLDDNGFIMITEKYEDTGKFFGEVDGMVMEMLVNSDVYKRVRVVDYQAVCYQPVSKSNFASILRTPLAHLGGLFNWVVAQFAWMLLQLNVHAYFNPDFSSVLASMSSEESPHQVEEEIGHTLPPFIELASINKTRLRPCDKETFLYTYGSSYNTHNFSYHGLLTKCGHSGCDGYFNVHHIPHTNLILVVTDGKCRCGLNSTTIRQREVQYSNVFKKQSSEQEPEIEDDDDLLSSSPVEVCRTPKPSLYRKRPSLCINYNPEEEYLREDCGHAPPTLTLSTLLLSSTLLISITRLPLPL